MSDYRDHLPKDARAMSLAEYADAKRRLLRSTPADDRARAEDLREQAALDARHRTPNTGKDGQ